MAFIFVMIECLRSSSHCVLYGVFYFSVHIIHFSHAMYIAYVSNMKYLLFNLRYTQSCVYMS